METNIDTVYIRTDDVQAVLEAVRSLGAEVVTGESNPLVAALFYVARINSKLDNLGQLRHLYRLEKDLGRVEASLDVLQKSAQLSQAKHEAVARQKRELHRRLIQQAQNNISPLTAEEVTFLPVRYVLERYRPLIPQSVYNDLYEEYAMLND